MEKTVQLFPARVERRRYGLNVPVLVGWTHPFAPLGVPLVEHEAVAEAAVVPAPDPIRYMVAKAYIALAPGYVPDRATAFSIFKHVRARLAPFKRVRRLEFAELPKTISGKIRRVELRGRENELARANERAPGEFRSEDFSDLA